MDNSSSFAGHQAASPQQLGHRPQRPTNEHTSSHQPYPTSPPPLLHPHQQAAPQLGRGPASPTHLAYVPPTVPPLALTSGNNFAQIDLSVPPSPAMLPGLSLAATPRASHSTVGTPRADRFPQFQPHSNGSGMLSQHRLNSHESDAPTLSIYQSNSEKVFADDDVVHQHPGGGAGGLKRSPTWMGRRRNRFSDVWRDPNSYWIRVSVYTSIAQALIISGLEVALLIMHRRALALVSDDIPKNGFGSETDYVRNNTIDRAKALVVYYALFILAQVVQLVLLLDATYTQNTLQIIALAIFNVLILAYSGIQMGQRRKIMGQIYDMTQSPNDMFADFIGSSHDPYFVMMTVIEIATIAITFLFASAFIYQAFRLYKVYGWNLFKKIGADLRMRGLYRVYQLLIVFLRFDLFFFLSFSIQYLALVIGPLQKTSDIAIHASVSVGCGLGLIILIYYAVRHESRAGTLLFIVGALGLVGYFGFKVWQLYTPDVYYGESKTCLKQCWPKESGCNYLCADKYQSSRIILTLFISVDIILAFLTCGVAFGAYRNFGRGLRYHLTRKSSGRNGAMQQAGGRRGGKDQPEMAEGSKPGRVRRQVNWKSTSKDNVNRASANSTSVPEGRRWSITQ